MTPHTLSPSRIARYFYHDCERYLRYHATPRALRAAGRVPHDRNRPSPFTAEIRRRGYEWEETVIGNYLNGSVRIASGEGPLHERAHGVRETLALLKDLQPGAWLYQPTLEASDAFLNRYGLDPARCRFPPCRPDLLRAVEDARGRRLQVIDIKASHGLKTSHRIQIALYGLLLRDALADAGSPLTVDLETGGIWLYERPEPEPVSLKPSLDAVERFLRDGLATILERPLEEVPWHLFFRCEWCEFFPHCHEEARAACSVSLLPYLSVGGRRFLRDAPWGGPAIDTLDDFAAFLEGPPAEVDAALEGCGSLRGRRAELRQAVTALKTEEVIAHGGSSPALPVNEHVKIVLTLHGDPHTGRLYALGVLRVKGQAVYGDPSSLKTWIAPSPEDCSKAGAWLLDTLFEALETLHRYNEGLAWADQKTLQAYVFDGYERTLLERLLVEALADADLAPRALRLLFYFQNEQLAKQDEHPEPETPYPVVVLTQVIRRLLALPHPLAVRLPDVLAVLPAPNFDYSLRPDDRYWFALSNTLKSDTVFELWGGRDPTALERLQDQLKRRLRAASAVADGLRERLRERLFAWPPRFRFPEARAFQHFELSQLAFITRYESFLQAQAVREGRTAPWETRLREGISLPLRRLPDGRWALLAPLDVSRLEVGDFPQWLLAPAGEAGERAQMGYNDYAYRALAYSPPNRGWWLAAVVGAEPATGNRSGCLTLAVQGDPSFEPDAEVVLHWRFTDFNSNRVVKCLDKLDSQPDGALLALVRDPIGFARPLSDLGLMPENVEGFTDSQRRAFDALCARRLTLVWGPPGTGKTYFLARATLSLVAAFAKRGRPLRVAITAFTHAAIENLLLEIRKQQAGLGLNDLALFKLKDLRTQRALALGLATACESKVVKRLGPAAGVVGGTVYSVQKIKKGEGLFDALIVDEASQMKFGELALALSALKPDGRLVLAGDDLQLPPIVQGQYPEREDGKPGLHDSIFAYLRARDDRERPYTWPLLDNWRMNATLCGFPARELYGEGYRPALPAVADRRIALAPVGEGDGEIDPLVEWLLDPAYPLAVGLLEGVRAAQENRVEAALVARLADALRARLLDGAGAVYPAGPSGDEAFWREGLFVVSPHHAQIEAIQQALAARRAWPSQPFVDTVDKMQGQESQAVIVSYGVSDPETASREGEFLYSVNRLNVSVTRARAKCVVLLPRPLLEPALELLQDEAAARGFGFMHALVDYAEGGESEVFPLDSPGAPAGCRLRALRRA
ncbi:MAG: AAA family ATPase [Candidatus Competibacteraceae bacterium]|nr:AAA family ATPase [Candidatus Competibacteraceae bacterium]